MTAGADNFRSSMTCAGLLALAVGHGANQKCSDDAGPQKDPAIQKGFRYLVKWIGPGTERVGQGKLLGVDAYGDLYYLWSLERVGVVYDVKMIRGKDWYAWASRVIVDTQKEEGHWDDSCGPGADTCFALLVLKRANVARDLTKDVKKLLNLKDIEGTDK